MKTTLTLLTFCLVFGNHAFAEKGKAGEIKINSQAKEGTIAVTKGGTVKVGVGAPPSKPESSTTEQDRREAQEGSGVRVFVEKEF